MPPQGGAKPKGAILDVARAPGQPGTRTIEEVAALQRFDKAWTLADRRGDGGACGAGSSQSGGEPKPKRKSKKQRQRQKQRALEAEAAKRAELVDGTHVSYAEAMRSGLLVAVTTATAEPLTAQAAEEVKVHLQERLVKDCIDATNEEPVFQGKPTYANGALKLWCGNHDTVGYLTRIVSEFTLSTGTRLMVKRQCDLVRLVRCGVLLPGKYPDIWMVRRALQQQNKWARVDTWIFHKVDRQGVITFLTFSAPKDVVQTLIERKRRLCFLLGSVYVKFQGPKGKFTEHPPTEQNNRMGNANDGRQAKGEWSGVLPAIPEPPPMSQSSPESQAEEAVDEEEEEGAAGLDNLAIGGTETEEELEVLSEDGLSNSPVL